MALSPVQVLCASASVALGALVQGSVGFGAAILAVPLLLWIDPVFVPGPTLLAGLVLRERAGIDVRGVGWALAGRVPGTALGVLALLWAPPRQLATLFAGLVLCAVALTASGLRVAPTRANLVGAGIASGVMGTMTSIGGPPVALVYQHAEGAALRGTLGAYFTLSGLISLAGLGLAGLLGARELSAALTLVPGTLVGFFASRWTRPALDRAGTRPAVLALAALAATGVLVKAC